jgi:predicted metal-dependent phosphoesterase TrpH
MLKCLKADLHIHTCLSPCAEAEMTPTAIVRGAVAKGLDMIGICDHNSAENVRALRAAAEGGPLTVLGGIEVTSQEEVHVLGLSDSSENNALDAMQRIIYENLSGENDESIFGEQLVCGEDGSITGHNRRLLIGATTLTIRQVVDAIRDLGGVAIASHIDRESFGIIGQLGFVPEGLALDALELSSRAGEREQWSSVSQQTRLPLVTSSDAHRLAEIGAASTSFEMESACIDELRKALHSRDGRRVVT